VLTPSIGESSGDVTTAARQVSLLRLLLLAIGLGVLVAMRQGHAPELLEPAITWLAWLLVTVLTVALSLAALVRWINQRWQLVMQLVFDLLWTGLLLHCTGGPGSNGVVLLFVIVLTGTLVLPGTAPFVLPALAGLILAGEASLYLARHTPLPDGFLTVNPALIDTNRILGMLATQVAALFLVDLLGQLLARRLREHRFFTGELLDQLGEGVLAFDRGGRVVYANAEAVRLLALGGGVLGRAAGEVLERVDLSPVRALVARADCPALERFASGEGRQLVLRLSELVDARGRPLGRTLLIADETRLRLLEESAQRTERLAALGEMAAGIAHEVRNPLTSLRGCAQELAEINRGEGQSDAADLATIMVGEADRLARIVDEFLTLSRLRPPQREAVELPGLFHGLQQLHAQRRDIAQDLRMDFTVAADCPPVWADQGQLRQVVGNLIENAIDALRRAVGPRLQVSATHVEEGSPLTGPAVLITVADNGCGIPGELRERVFTPFFSTKSQGTGLGLSLVGRLVKEHEGVLQLDSALGSGTTVRVYLPAHSQTGLYRRALGAG